MPYDCYLASSYPRVRHPSRLEEYHTLHELDGGELDTVVRGGQHYELQNASLALTQDVPLLTMCPVRTPELARLRFWHSGGMSELTTNGRGGGRRW
jgi:hypothetical protein